MCDERPQWVEKRTFALAALAFVAVMGIVWRSRGQPDSFG
jgi:hypothetical protein